MLMSFGCLSLHGGIVCVEYTMYASENRVGFVKRANEYHALFRCVISWFFYVTTNISMGEFFWLRR